VSTTRNEGTWLNLFTATHEASFEEKQLFFRCCKTMLLLSKQIISSEQEDGNKILIKLADLLRSNPLKVCYPGLTLKLLTLISQVSEVADYLAQHEAMSIVKGGLTHQHQEIRRNSLAFMKNIAQYDRTLGAFDSIIDQLRKSSTLDVRDIEAVESCAIPALQAMQFAVADSDTSLVLLILGSAEVLVDLLQIKSERVQLHALKILDGMGWAPLHVNQIAFAGGLTALLQCTIATDNPDLVKALALSFTNLMLKTTHIGSVAECLPVCRYTAGKNATVDHLISLLGSSDANAFAGECKWLRSYDTKRETDEELLTFVKNLKKKVNEIYQ